MSGSRILVTNDDGIGSPGILDLARAVASSGHDVVVAAPAFESSGTSAAIGPIRPGTLLDFERVELFGDTGLPAFTVDGPPGRCVVAAALGAFGKAPDVVLSGINRGANIGWFSLLHSGTVGAALTAGGFGLRGMAVSLEFRPDESRGFWGTASRVAVALLPSILEAPRCTVWNLNVPNVCSTELRGLRRARLSRSAGIRLGLDEVSLGELRMTLVPSPATDVPPDDEGALLGAGYAALTRIVPASTADIGEVSIFGPEALD